MGASVNLVTKSGTNSLRGQVYEWFRGADLDANNYFDKPRPAGPSATTRTTASASPSAARSRATGPSTSRTSRPTRSRCRRPVILTRADREDAQRRFLGAARARPAVPDLRPGDDPAASDAGRPLHPRSVPRQHHSGRAASTRSRRNILGFYPLPNQAGTADGANNYTNPTAVAFETYYTATARVDHNLSRPAPPLRPLQLGLLGRGEGRPLRQPRDRHLPQPQEPRLRARRCLHAEEQPAAERARRIHAAVVPRAPAQPGLRPGVARLLATR